MVKVISEENKIEDIIGSIRAGENFIVVDKKGNYRGILPNDKIVKYLFEPQTKIKNIYIKIKPLNKLDFVEISKKMLYSNLRIIPIKINEKIELIDMVDILDKIYSLEKNIFDNIYASDIMNPPVLIEERENLKKIISIMKNKGVSRVIVVNKEGKAVGILSVSDIIRYFTFEKERATKGELADRSGDIEARSIVREKLIYAEPETKISKIIELLNKNKIYAIPILKNEIPVGIITAKDILAYYLSIKEKEELPVIVHGISIDEIDITFIRRSFKELYRKYSNYIGNNPRLILHIKKIKEEKKGLKRISFFNIKAKLLSDKIKIFITENGYEFYSTIKSVFKILEYELEEKKSKSIDRYYIDRLIKENLEYL
ncbi:MAG: CBS domain-containing protein [Nanopusillaceae archaeon]